MVLPSATAPRLAVAALLLGTAACGEARQLHSDPPIESLTAELVPAVEKAVGLKFKRPPSIAARSREQVKSYLSRKLDTDMPAEEVRGVTLAYRIFGLIPDTLDLRALLLALYTEQVVGYYDPDSSMLYVVQGTDRTQARLVLAHELVHALQGQYLSLDSLLDQPHQNDRRMAVQAVMEGQATLASLTALMPDQDYDSLPEFWHQFRQTVRAQQSNMPVFRSAPLIIREDLIFPYLAGADFVRWFRRSHPDTVPFGPRLPQSTEQVLHPDRYRDGDRPVSLAFPSGTDLVYQDGLGEFETRVLLTQLSGEESLGVAGAMGWAGDRYAVLSADPGDALVWWTLWDTPEAGQRFAQLLEKDWPTRERPGRRAEITRQAVGARAGVRLVDAPTGWGGWAKVPEVEVR
jgi:Zn-dependent peptidase ImmA (M78 family)